MVYDRQGREISSLREDLRIRNLAWVSYRDISPALLNKMIQAEDRKFFLHRGVDYRALLASAYQRIFKSSSRGGSTITMQVVKLLSPPRQNRGYGDKIRQLLLAARLEKSWSKEQIFETYLNLLDFRGEYRGLRTAAQAFFHKNPAGLDITEASLLAAMVRAPNAGFEKIGRRACLLAPEDCDNIKMQTQILAQLRPRMNPVMNQAPHFARWIKTKMKESRDLHSSLDGELQRFANEALQTQISSLLDQNVHDGAILVLDNKTGEVLAYVGSSGGFSTAEQMDGVQARRQVGSTLKPFLYATAFEKGILTPESWIEDSPVEIVFPNGVYRPQNHDKNFHSWVRARSALASSLNVPAVKIYKMLNDESLWERLNKMHLQNLKEADLYGPALALGVADLSLWDLTNAYRTLANGGEWSPPRWDREASKERAREKIFPPEVAATITDILGSREDRQLGFGFDTSLATSFPSAVKTGTSKDMRDNWCFGYSKDYTVGIWVGNFNGEPMWNVLGVSGAAPLWNKILTWLHENRRSQSGLEVKIAAKPVERKDSSPQPSRYPISKILYPPSGLVVALDPDIPSQNQKIPLMAYIEGKDRSHWSWNGKFLAQGSGPVSWSPSKGKHRFELIQENQVLDSIEILVK